MSRLYWFRANSQLDKNGNGEGLISFKSRAILDGNNWYDAESAAIDMGNGQSFNLGSDTLLTLISM